METHPIQDRDGLNIALFGAGQMARNHARAIRNLADPLRVRVVAVADPDSEALEQIRSIWPGAHTFGAADQLLASSAVDVVHVCTPAGTHAALAERALDAGCHVYVEKPFTDTPEQAEGLVTLAAERGLLLCAGHQLLFQDPTPQLLETVKYIGHPAHIESYFSFRPSRGRGDGKAALRRDLQLRDILPHPIYLATEALQAFAPGDRPELRHVSVGSDGTVHAVLEQGGVTATVVVTLTGRPVENYLRLVGSRGSATGDYVRNILVKSLGPGHSTLDKVFEPYRRARQLVWNTSGALLRRFVTRQKSYPGLGDLIEAFYRAILEEGPSPIRADSLLDVTKICSRIASRLPAIQVDEGTVPAGPLEGSTDRLAIVTGGTGFLGKALCRRLVDQGWSVRSLSRNLPAGWERVGGVDYVACDLADGVPAEALHGAAVLFHCAAETTGGFDEHARNSLQTVERLVEACAQAGVGRLVHVSSLAVLDPAGSQPLDESSPLPDDARALGPYVWGKVESERRARELCRAYGLDLKVIRPAAILDFEDFDPPGKLGRRLGKLFVAVGPRRGRLAIVERSSAAGVLAQYAFRNGDLPDTLNLLDPELPRRSDLVARLHECEPDLRVLWLPRPILKLLSAIAKLVQLTLRPGRPALDVASAFEQPSYSTESVRAIVAHESGRSAEPAAEPESRDADFAPSLDR